MSERWITYRGRSRRLSDWAREYDLRPSTLRTRLEAGMPVDRALRLRPMSASARARLGAKRSPWRL